MARTGFFILSIILFCSCGVLRKNYDPAKKYPKAALQKDYTLLRNILEAKHPSLYWYTSKEKMDAYFDKYYADITDSMNEQQFAWHVLAPLIQKIHCGHTSVSMSKAYGRWVTGKIIPAFPLYMKVWNDTMAVTANLNYKKDSIFKRGTLVTAVNGVPNKLLIKYFMEFLPEDGYEENVNYVRISGNFPYFHRNIFGLSKTYKVSYLDSSNQEQTVTVPLYIPPKDSLRRDSIQRKAAKHIPKTKQLLQDRSMVIDSSKKFAVMTVNTFAQGYLRGFFRRSFRRLKKEKINTLVLDIRSNGGGRVEMSTLLTKYISRSHFRVADTVFTPERSLGKYARYTRGRFFNNIEMFFLSKKMKDGNYHLRHFENHVYGLKKNKFDGKVYVLINGPTFSASALFSNAVKGQPGITLMGENTGGGWYGNNGIMIPDIILPHTKLRVRLPVFRLIQYQHPSVKGTGVPPDIYVPTDYQALIKGQDKKMEEVKRIMLAP